MNVRSFEDELIQFFLNQRINKRKVNTNDQFLFKFSDISIKRDLNERSYFPKGMLHQLCFIQLSQTLTVSVRFKTNECIIQTIFAITDTVFLFKVFVSHFEMIH